MIKRGADVSELKVVLTQLANDEPLDEKYYDHPLKGDKNNTRDCHIQNDWVLFYIKKGKTVLQLVRTGTHADLFG
jgi:mRNA interferase YafQ